MAETSSKSIPVVPPQHWFWKNLTLFGQNPLAFFIANHAQYGDLFDVNVPKVRLLALSKPDYVKHVLVDNNKNYVKAFAYTFLREALGNGLLTSEGEFWLKQRRIAQPAFHRERLTHLSDRMVAHTKTLLDRWEEKRTDKQAFNVATDMMHLTSGIAASALFSSDVSRLAGSIVSGVGRINEFTIKKIATPYIFRTPLWLPTPANVRFLQVRRRLDQIILQLIDNRRQSAERYDDLLQMLLEACDEETGETMSDRQLRDEVMTLFIAGSETSSNALTWALYLLDKHSEVRDKLYAEVRENLQGRIPTPADFPNLSYTQQVIQETMRLYPPAWVLGREALQDDVIDGYAVPKGAQVYICTYVMHRHVALWNEPEQFRPERFAPDQVKARHKSAYIPFGSGPRFCIGSNFALMEMTIVLAMIAQRVRLRLDENHPVALEPLVTLRPKNGLWMRVE